jgi:hypothetical protein
MKDNNIGVRFIDMIGGDCVNEREPDLNENERF